MKIINFQRISAKRNDCFTTERDFRFRNLVTCLHFLFEEKKGRHGTTWLNTTQRKWD